MHVCLITGATSGIGRAAALALARPGTRLILTGRNDRAGRQVVGQCQALSPAIEAEFIAADLACLRDVRVLADTVKGRIRALDVLINNAGARFDRFERTEDGIERTFATNHLGHFLLTALLLDRLLSAPAARVVVTGSSAHHHVDAEGDWCLGQSNWSKRVAYGKSKLANIIFAYEMARRLGGTSVTANAVDPGTPLTRFARNNGLLGWLKHVGYHLSRGELTAPVMAGRLIAGLAMNEAHAGQTGRYISSSGEIPSSKPSRDAGASSRLWNLSLKLAGLDEGLGPSWKYLQPLV